MSIRRHRFILRCILPGIVMLTFPPAGADNLEPPAIYEGGYGSPEHYPGMELVWRDEFEANAPRKSDWTRQAGPGGRARERAGLQTFRPENTLQRDGYLVISSEAETAAGTAYTSSRIETRGKKEFRFGRIDVRARLPNGRGLWPSIGLLGANVNQAGWPACGEIGIVGMDGAENRRDKVHATAHWRESEGHRFAGGSFTVPTWSFSDDFHLFSVVWDESRIEWLVDERPYYELDIRGTRFDAFRFPFFLFVELAVSESDPRLKKDAGVFPQWLVVDYIRVFQASASP